MKLKSMQKMYEITVKLGSRNDLSDRVSLRMLAAEEGFAFRLPSPSDSTKELVRSQYFREYIPKTPETLVKYVDKISEAIPDCVITVRVASVEESFLNAFRKGSVL